MATEAASPCLFRCVFEAALYHYGPDFAAIATKVTNKSERDIVDWYQLWKLTDAAQHWAEHHGADSNDVKLVQVESAHEGAESDAS